MKSLKFFVGLILIAISFSSLHGQDDPILFTVEGNEVHLSEFNYIYNKNNGEKADYSESSINEYLDLYTKFKLKVQKAKDMKLDTIPVLINELAGYRKQLADSYLTDKEVTERLIKEVYDRQQYDVKVRHIVVRINKRANEDQKAQARKRIEDIAQKLKDGADFVALAKAQSQDVNTKKQGGELNYLSAMLPDGYYDFENAMYTLKEGEISDVIESNIGYHIVQLIDKRPARGQLEAAHILLRKKKKNVLVPNVKGRIDSIHLALTSGANFEELVRQYSEDANTVAKGGNLGIFGISTYEKKFEDAAFALENDGDISMPVETSIGWHIIKRIHKPEKDTYEKARRKLQAQIRKDGRYEMAKDQMIEQIKVDANLEENKVVLETFANGLDKEFYSYKWRPEEDLTQTLFTLGGKKVSLGTFAKHCKDNTRKRLRFNKSIAPIKAVQEMYDDYLKDQCLKYEEANLENKYPDFKALMREYEEGILLFEATKLNVWDKASQDTSGLKKFFKDNQDDYMWKERADLTTYIVKTTDEKLANKIAKYIKKNGPDKVLAKFNTDQTPVSYSESIHERGDLELAGIKFKVNSISDARPDMKSKTFKIRKITKLYPATPKTLKDARGYIIADYQDSLDKAWIQELKEAYEVNINQDVLKSIIK